LALVSIYIHINGADVKTRDNIVVPTGNKCNQQDKCKSCIIKTVLYL